MEKHWRNSRLHLTDKTEKKQIDWNQSLKYIPFKRRFRESHFDQWFSLTPRSSSQISCTVSPTNTLSYIALWAARQWYVCPCVCSEKRQILFAHSSDTSVLTTTDIPFSKSWRALAIPVSLETSTWDKNRHTRWYCHERNQTKALSAGWHDS